MKKKIRKWLGLDEEYDRLSGAILELSKGQMMDGDVVKVDSLKEFVFEMAKYLKLKPHRTFREVPVESVATKIERVYEVIKVK